MKKTGGRKSQSRDTLPLVINPVNKLNKVTNPFRRKPHEQQTLKGANPKKVTNSFRHKYLSTINSISDDVAYGLVDF